MGATSTRPPRWTREAFLLFVLNGAKSSTGAYSESSEPACQRPYAMIEKKKKGSIKLNDNTSN